MPDHILKIIDSLWIKAIGIGSFAVGSIVWLTTMHKIGGEMKKLIFILMMFWSGVAFGADVTLKWNANTDNTVGYDVGYRVDGMLDYTIEDVGNVTQFEIKGLENEMIYFFAVRSYAANGLTSEWCQEIDNVKPSSVKGFKIINITINIQ